MPLQRAAARAARQPPVRRHAAFRPPLEIRRPANRTGRGLLHALGSCAHSHDGFIWNAIVRSARLERCPADICEPSMLDQALSAFVTLFVTIDPPGLAPLFLGITAGMSRAQRGRIAMRASLIAFGVLVLFAVAGTAILSLFGITIHSFRIAGGLLLFFIAFEMIFERRHDRHERSAERAVTEDQIRNIAVFPARHPADRRPRRDLRHHPAVGHLFRALGAGDPDPHRGRESRRRMARLPGRRADRPLPRRHRPHRADAPARPDPGGARGAVRHRRRDRRSARSTARRRVPRDRGANLVAGRAPLSVRDPASSVDLAKHLILR